MDTTENCLRCSEIDNCWKVEEHVREVPVHGFPVIKFFLDNCYWFIYQRQDAGLCGHCTYFKIIKLLSCPLVHQQEENGISEQI